MVFSLYENTACDLCHSVFTNRRVVAVAEMSLSTLIGLLLTEGEGYSVGSVRYDVRSAKSKLLDRVRRSVAFQI